MVTRTTRLGVAPFVWALLALGCAAGGDVPDWSPSLEGDPPLGSVRTVAGITLGEPLAVSVDFGGDLLVADGSPGRVVRIAASADDAQEFQLPPQHPAFHPSDLKLSGFFVYVLDDFDRSLLRFDKTGAFRDVLINFELAFEDRLIFPVGLDVDGSGRIVVSDVKNHQVILFDSYLDVELVFGNYGRFPGQFDSPEGVSFTADGGLLVTDSGNRRVQLFDAGAEYIRSIPEGSAANPLQRPRRAVMDARGWVYVADPQAGRVFVFDEGGRHVRSIIPRGARSFRPTDVAVAHSGTVYVTDTANSSLYSFR